MAAIKKLESFNGMEDVERFIDRFEFAVDVDEVASAKQASVLVMHLNGAAYDVWKGIPETDKKNVAKIKEVLRNTYGVRRSAAWRAMTAYRINAGQQLDSACEELHKWAKIVTAGKNPAATLTAVAFVEALPGHIAQRVRVLCGQSATKEEVVAAAKDVWDDAEFEVTAAVQNRPMGRGFMNTQRRTSQRNVSPSSRTSGKETRRCFGCGMVGHLRRACTAVCARCGGKQHVEGFCQKLGNEIGEQ